ncbi:major capsid protein [Paenibacillus phage vB_PlaP_API480]|nr:major capsid protein [Paenibacillus phage vB_PlaP_API480]
MANINTTATVNTGSGANSTKPNAFYDKVLLKTLVQRDFEHAQCAQKRDMPKKAGDTINFRKIGKLVPNLTPLVEGVTPTGDSATISAISAVTKQYGRYMTFSDVIDVKAIDPIITEYIVELGRVMRETLDTLIVEELNKTTNIVYSGGTKDEASVTEKPSIDDFRKIRLAMRRNFVKPAKGGDYVAFISPSVSFDLQDDPKFQKAMEYSNNAKPIWDGEIARIYGIRFVEVLNAKTDNEKGLHYSFMVGQQAYGNTKISGEGDVKSIIKSLGSSGTEDPLDQRQTIGVKVNAFVSKILDPLAVAKYVSKPTNA